MKTLLIIACVSLLCLTSFAQVRREARWCLVSDEEVEKCEKLVDAINKRQSENLPFPPGYDEGYLELPELKCIRAQDQFDCMMQIGQNQADLVQLEPGLGYTGGEYYNMLPLMAEKYDTVPGDSGLEYYAVAVARKDHPNINFDNLEGKKACHTGVGRAAGWVHPVSTLIEAEKMPIVECNVPVKSAAAFFGSMCAPNGLTRYYNPFGNNPVSVCENCQGDIENYCTTNDPYAGYDGAFRCMASEDGEVAFVRHFTPVQASKNATWEPSDFELLCTDGRRAPVDEASTCNWGEIASHIIMTSNIHNIELQADYKRLLKLMSWDFGAEGQNKDIFEMFNSLQFGKANLIFTDATMELKDVAEVDGGSRLTYFDWVGEEHRERLEILNTCPIQMVRFCVVSRFEMSKCENMIMAFAAKTLKPDLNCILGTSVRDCMHKIRMGDADLITLDSADVYTAGKHYGLVPIAAEDYTGYEAANYYAVAVARRTDSYLTLFNLKQRRSCHSAVMTAAGWIIPVDKLIETGQIHVHGCNSYFSVGQFFSKSCVPGVLNVHYNTKGTNPINLCEACAAGGNDRCERDANELYFGNSGAFRCLTEVGGDVAFVKHTTVRENTDGRNRAEWARNRRSDDYELMCNDGTRKDIDSWRDCNLGLVPSNAIVTADFKPKETRDIYWTLLNFAQQFFASDDNEDFPMFDSMLDHKDLIFQDSTVRLIHVNEVNQTYEKYLGPAFMRAMERNENIDCITGSWAYATRASGLVTLFTLLLLTVLFH